MPNWCNNSIAFYHADSRNDLLGGFFADAQKFQDYIDPETGETSNWIGYWLKSREVDADNLYCRGFINYSELTPNHVHVYMDTAWSPLPEVWDILAEQYGLSYVYIAEECGCEVYVNTDTEGRFYSDRYILNYFDIDELYLDDETLTEYGERLRELSGETIYFESWSNVERTFKDFEFDVTSLKSLNEKLDKFNLHVYEFSAE